MSKLFVYIVLGMFVGGIAGAYMVKREESVKRGKEVFPEFVLNQRAPRERQVSKNSCLKGGIDFKELIKGRPSVKKSEMLNNYCAGLTALELAEEIRKIKTLSLDGERYLIYVLLLKLAQKDPRLALQESNQLKIEIGGVFDIWASQNPQEAAAYYSANRENIYIGEVVDIVKRWGAVDMESAWSWAETLTSGERGAARGVLLAMLAKKDIALAVGKLASLPQEEQSRKTASFSMESLYSKVAKEWVVKDGVAAREWIKTLPEAEREDVFRVAIAEFSKKEPEKAMGWAMEDIQESGFNFFFVSGDILKHWRQKDMEGAKQWIKELPEGNQRNNLVNQYIYCGGISEDFPQNIAFIEEMNLPQKSRQQALSNLVSNWRCKNEKEAVEWLNSSSLSGEEKKAILEQEKGSKMMSISTE